MKFGVLNIPHEPVKKIADLAVLTEQLGYDLFLVSDHRLSRDVYPILAAAALRTKRVELGPCVLDPYSRYPALSAGAVATIDEMSDGRAILGIGAGGTAFKQMEIVMQHPVQAIKEAVETIRLLFSGEEVHYEGKTTRLKGAKLDIQPVHDIPIYVTGRGPKVLQVAGEVGDGVLIGYTSEIALKYALKNIEIGVKRSRRHLKDLDLVCFAYVSVSDNPKIAQANVLPYASRVWRSASKFRHLIFTDDETASQRIPDSELALAMHCIAGDPSYCIERIQKITDLGITSLWILPFSARDDLTHAEKVIEPFAEKVMTQL